MPFPPRYGGGAGGPPRLGNASVLFKTRTPQAQREHDAQQAAEALTRPPITSTSADVLEKAPPGRRPAVIRAAAADILRQQVVLPEEATSSPLPTIDRPFHRPGIARPDSLSRDPLAPRVVIPQQQASARVRPFMDAPAARDTTLSPDAARFMRDAATASTTAETPPLQQVSPTIRPLMETPFIDDGIPTVIPPPQPETPETSSDDVGTGTGTPTIILLPSVAEATTPPKETSNLARAVATGIAVSVGGFVAVEIVKAVRERFAAKRESNPRRKGKGARR